MAKRCYFPLICREVWEEWIFTCLNLKMALGLLHTILGRRSILKRMKFFRSYQPQIFYTSPATEKMVSANLIFIKLISAIRSANCFYCLRPLTLPKMILVFG